MADKPPNQEEKREPQTLALPQVRPADERSDGPPETETGTNEEGGKAVGAVRAVQPDMTLPLVLTIEEAAEVLRIGRTAAYEAARRGELPVVRIGHRTLRVPRHKLEALLGLDDAPKEERSATDTGRSRRSA